MGKMVRSSWVYRQRRRFRAGIEGCLSMLKRVFGLRRCTWKGWARLLMGSAKSECIKRAQKRFSECLNDAFDSYERGKRNREEMQCWDLLIRLIDICNEDYARELEIYNGL